MPKRLTPTKIIIHRHNPSKQPEKHRVSESAATVDAEFVNANTNGEQLML